MIYPSLATILNVTDTNPIKIIYHNSCPDGFACAFLFWNYHYNYSELPRPKIEFFAADYGTLPPNLQDCHLVLADFSYKRPVLEQIKKVALSITILDHHESEEKDIVDFSNNYPDVKYIFDNKKSGSGIVWDLLYPEDEIAPLIAHIQDRDLWQFCLPKTREVLATLASYPMDFGSWLTCFNSDINDLIAEGKVIRRYQQEVGKTILRNTHRTTFDKYNGIPIVNCPWFLISEIVGTLSQGEMFAMGYFDSNTRRHFSLRSQKSGINVYEIARRYGGGGHRNAAGFTVPLRKLGIFQENERME